MTGGQGRRVAVVTGGGRGIGAAIAEELGRSGAFVVTVDPLVAVDGAADPGAASEPTTADRIVAAGGAARASAASVTDRAAVEELFAALVDEFGAVDAVVNVAGISRPTSFAAGDEADWHDVVSVHLDGYRNVLHAALPRMVEAGRGRILGVTSGSGWRAADAGAYSCAKRAVAALTWQLGRVAPPGVTVNALSPIALTRMVTSALSRGGSGPRTRAPAAVSTAASGGLALGTGMPSPEEIGPLGAHLVAGGLPWCSGQVVFAGGSELALVEPPRLLELVRTDAVGSLAHVLDAVGVGALVPAEARQATTGGSNPRFGAAFGTADADLAGTGGVCGIVVDEPARAAAVRAALEARGARCEVLDPAAAGPGFAGAAAALAAVAERSGGLDAVVVGRHGMGAGTAGGGWEQVLAEHDGLADAILADAAWARAAADHAAATGRPLRLVALVDARSAGGRSRAQAAAQLARSAVGATDGRVAALTLAVEAGGDEAAVGEVAAHLACHPEAGALSGAELVAGAGWFGLRSHPRPGASIVYGGPALPTWIDDALRAVVTGSEEPR